MFQPWELDNCKIMHDGWMPLAIGFVGQYLSRLWRASKSILIRVFLVVLFFASIASGFLSLLTYEGHLSDIYTPDHAETGRWVAENCPVSAVFAASATLVMIPSAVFGGRRQYYGNDDWIRSHGLANGTRGMFQPQFERGENPHISLGHGVNYLIRANRIAIRTAPVDEKPWWEIVYEYEKYAVYKLNWESQQTTDKKVGTVRRKAKQQRTTSKDRKTQFS
jgi:hypothetical protein